MNEMVDDAIDKGVTPRTVGQGVTKAARLLWMAVTIMAALPAPGMAQAEPITTAPPNIIIPNYNGVPAGPLGGLEGSAYVARATDTSAPWLNPAGLTKAGTQISGSAGTYKLTTVSPGFLPSDGGSTQQVPNLVGATAKLGRFTVGFALVTSVSWGQGTDTDDVFTNPEGNPERYAFSADSSMNQRVAAAAIAYDLGKTWHVGGGLAVTDTGFRSTQVISDRIKDAHTLNTLLISSRTGGSSSQLRAIVGVQAEPTSAIRVGAMIRTPGIQFGQGGEVTLDSTLDGSALSIGASIFDPSAQFSYKLPFETAGGIAFVAKRAELEFDVQGYSSIAPHALLSSSEPITIYRDPGNGTPTIEERPFPSVITASRAIANFSLGGHVQLTESRPLTLHAGVATDRSPVAPEDQAFDRVDFVVWTVGASGSIGKLSFALGANYRKGSSDNIVLRNLLSEPIHTSISVKTIGLTYAINYKF
jgi:hypothetical protein